MESKNQLKSNKPVHTDPSCVLSSPGHIPTEPGLTSRAGLVPSSRSEPRRPEVSLIISLSLSLCPYLCLPLCLSLFLSVCFPQQGVLWYKRIETHFLFYLTQKVSFLGGTHVPTALSSEHRFQNLSSQFTSQEQIWFPG